MTPQIAESAYVDESAVVTGDVVIKANASIWPNATLRGDSGKIVVGKKTNIQDNAVVHEGTTLEPKVTVGHSGIVHSATVAEGALIGMNGVVLDNAHIGNEAVVGAGAVVTEGTAVPPMTLVTGTPAEPQTELDDFQSSAVAEHYVELAQRYEQTSERID